ncbi:chitinase N-terminal domain-containing protein, partial [Marilutibacter aestuarii]
SWSTIHNAAGTSKSVSGLTNGSYEYRVRACNEGGCSGYSNIDTTVVTHPPDGPTVSTPAADNNGAYSVSWSSVSTATEYRLEQRKNGGSWSQIYSGTGLSKAVSGLTNGTYDYRARACNAGGCSGYSATDTTVVTFPPSSAPTLTAPTSADTATNFTVSWTAVSTATAYELQMGFNGAGWTTVYNSSARSVTRSHNFDGSYDYRVRACNAGGCGPFSGVRRVQVVDIGGGGPCHEGVCPEPDAVNPIEEES